MGNSNIPIHTIELQPIHPKPSSLNGGKDSSRQVRSDWGAVYVIIGAFGLGLAFAIGHDAFNRRLHGKPVDDITISQQWVTRFGTAFTFLAKTCLTASVGTAYVQHFWRILRARAFKVQYVDALMAAPSDIKNFLDPRPWFRVPGLLIMGLTIWCIPLATIVAPGTLTVVYRPRTNSTALQVPQLGYNVSTWASIGPLSSSFEFWSASKDVQRAGFGAATTGTVLSVPHTYANETYHLDFDGPAIRCQTANDTVRDQVEKTVKGFWGSGGYYSYWAWVGNNDHGLLSQNLTVSDTWETLDSDSTDAARLFVYSANGTGEANQLFRQVSECLLYNASYSVDFMVQNGNSVASVNEVNLNAKIPSQMTLSMYDDSIYEPNVTARYTYQSVMDTFGQLLVGYAYSQNSGTQVHYTSYLRTHIQWGDPEETQQQMETLFQNMTLSMFSNSNLLLDPTKAAPVPVTVTNFPLTYQYEPKDLWIAYGCAIFATLAASLVGIQAIWGIGSSYSSKFSTVARITRDTDLYQMIVDGDDGSDPLPKNIGQQSFQIIKRG